MVLLVKIRKGFTLIEVIIVLTISTILILSVIKLYTYLYQNQLYIMRKLELQQQVQTVLFKMVKDIKRSGMRVYDPNIDDGNWELFVDDDNYIKIFNKTNNDGKSCILFLYDLNLDGCVGTKHNNQCRLSGSNNTKELIKELFGYRLNKNSLEIRNLTKQQINTKCSKKECTEYMAQSSCNSGRWFALLDENIYKVIKLEFNWLKQRELLELILSVSTKNKPEINYQSKAIVHLLNY